MMLYAVAIGFVIFACLMIANGKTKILERKKYLRIIAYTSGIASFFLLLYSLHNVFLALVIFAIVAGFFVKVIFFD